MTALTQLTHEGPRSSVNFSQHVQPQSALGTNMYGLWAVSGQHRNPRWSRWTHIRPAICPLQAVFLSSKLPRFFVVKYIFRFRPKMASLFCFCLFFGRKRKFFSRLFLFYGRKSKIHFRLASSFDTILDCDRWTDRETSWETASCGNWSIFVLELCEK